MQRFNKIFLIIILKNLLLANFCAAWKPITGGATISSGFNLQQTHSDVPIEKKTYIINAPDASEFSNAYLQQEQTAGDIFKETHHAAHLLHGDHASTLTKSTFSFGNENNADILDSLFKEDRCAVKKFAFNNDGTAVYEHNLPELNQFTICFWMRFTNHSGDHVILTYSVEDEAREIQLWVANSKNSSFISMAIKGQQMYRLNYPLRRRQWHHICSSWNGKTGEWQVWLKAERIGRGFHNSLVGHQIPAKGKLYSGGNSITGEIAQGIHFETTLIQIYRIALSAGKAHRDHKHHHAHHFDHDGREVSTTTKAPPQINRPLAMHSLLASGQIPTRVRINLAQPNQAQTAPNALPVQALQNNFLAATANNAVALPQNQPSVSINTNFVNGQINTGSRLIAQQLIGLPAGPNPRSPISLLSSSSSLQLQPQIKQTTTTNAFSVLNNPANVQFIDETETRIFFKRHAQARTAAAAATAANAKAKTNADILNVNKQQQKNLKKRGLVLLNDGSVVDDELIKGELPYDGLAEFGDQQFKNELNGKINIEHEIKTHDREPAEEEVKAVMSLCSACEVEPFQGAIVFAWKDVKEQLDNALKGYGEGRCEDF